MVRVLLGLGSNLGDRAAWMQSALELLALEDGIDVRACSRFVETRPVGGSTGQDPYLNACAVIDTRLSPFQLHAVLIQVEQTLQRRRDQRWEARTIDVDLLLYGHQVVDEPDLKIPHPRMPFRRFVLEPAAEVAGDMIHVSTAWTVQRLLKHLDASADWVAIEASAEEPAKRLATEVARQTGSVLFARQRPANPSGQSQGPTLEFLHSQFEALRQCRDQADGKMVVTDFWPQRALTQLRVPMTLGQFEFWQPTSLQARDRVGLPRLSVLYIPESDPYPSATDDWMWRWQLELPDQGPLLTLSQTSFQQAVQEVVAAIDAMLVDDTRSDR